MARSIDDLECSACGYALRGLPEHVCPECGRAFDPQAMLAAEDEPRVGPESASRLACVATIIAIISVIITPFVGLQQLEHMAYAPYSCRSIRSESDILHFLAMLAIAWSWISVAMTAQAQRHALLTRAAALATTTAWLTMWLLVV